MLPPKKIAIDTNLLDLLGHCELDGVGDEFGVLLDDVLDLLLLKVFDLIFLEEETHLGTTSERRVDGVKGDGEGATGGRLPDVLFVVVVFCDDLHSLGDEVSRVETDTELTDHRNIGTGVESLHEALSDQRC